MTVPSKDIVNSNGKSTGQHCVLRINETLLSLCFKSCVYATQKGVLNHQFVIKFYPVVVALVCCINYCLKFNAI